MIGSDDQKSSSIYNRSYTITSISTDFSVKPKPYLNSSFQRSESVKKVPDSSFGSIKGKVRSICNLFESRRASKLSSNDSKLNTGKSNSIEELNRTKSNFKESDSSNSIRLPGTEDRVVVYFTSLRGIRRTYEDCYSVRMILKFFRVVIDERDISMDSNYKKELLTVLGGNTQFSLPQVFIKGKYVGGADVIKQLHETGQLGKMLKELPVRSTNAWQVCDACGDVRFIPCANCNGSKKVYDEDEDLLKRCPDCNENGLIRCPTCCS